MKRGRPSGTPVRGGITADSQKRGGRMRGLIAGKYEVVEEIGRGAAGTIYKARDKRRDSIVALRLLPDVAADSEQRALLEQRVQAARDLQHDHIVPVLGLAREGN